MFFFSRPRPLSVVALALIVGGLALAHDGSADTGPATPSLVRHLGLTDGATLHSTAQPAAPRAPGGGAPNSR
jgi:hypothetical protein